MRDLTKAQILAHAKADFPREVCGLITVLKGKEIYVPCKNIAESDQDFIMDPIDYANAEDASDIVAIVHSHCNLPAKASQADLVGCENSKMPWHIVSLPSETWETIKPSGYEAPLIGRTFHHGVLDCYSLVRDWYKKEKNISLPDFDRVEKWWEKGQELYLENFGKAGFYEIPDIFKMEPGDVILMQIASDAVNHSGIYLGDNIMLHHSMNRLSCREVFGGYWLKNTRKVVRYGGET